MGEPSYSSKNAVRRQVSGYVDPMPVPSRVQSPEYVLGGRSGIQGGKDRLPHEITRSSLSGIASNTGAGMDWNWVTSRRRMSDRKKLTDDSLLVAMISISHECAGYRLNRVPV